MIEKKKERERNKCKILKEYIREKVYCNSFSLYYFLLIFYIIVKERRITREVWWSASGIPLTKIL